MPPTPPKTARTSPPRPGWQRSHRSTLRLRPPSRRGVRARSLPRAQAGARGGGGPGARGRARRHRAGQGHPSPHRRGGPRRARSRPRRQRPRPTGALRHRAHLLRGVAARGPRHPSGRAARRGPPPLRQRPEASQRGWCRPHPGGHGQRPGRRAQRVAVAGHLARRLPVRAGAPRRALERGGAAQCAHPRRPRGVQPDTHTDRRRAPAEGGRGPRPTCVDHARWGAP